MFFWTIYTHSILWNESLALTIWDLRCFEDLEEKGELVSDFINELITKVFVEQPRLHRVC